MWVTSVTTVRHLSPVPQKRFSQQRRHFKFCQQSLIFFFPNETQVENVNGSIVVHAVASQQKGQWLILFLRGDISVEFASSPSFCVSFVLFTRSQQPSGTCGGLACSPCTRPNALIRAIRTSTWSCDAAHSSSEKEELGQV